MSLYNFIIGALDKPEMASNLASNIDDDIEEEDENDQAGREIKYYDRYPDTPNKKLVIDMSGSDVDIKKESLNANPEGNLAMFFGSEGGGFLDILASVATSKLEEERCEGETKKPRLQVNEENIQPEFISNSEQFKTENQFIEIEHAPTLPGTKRHRDNEGSFTALSKRANPRRLADYERFGFAQISRMSLNTLLRLFSEPDFDEMRRMYSYKCYFMPDGECQEKVQSFGNEARAKAQMKNHLQSHIKETLKRDDYYQFTAEPVSARKKRLAQQNLAGTNNNTDPEPLVSSVQPSKDPGYITKVIKEEFLHDDCINAIRVPERAIDLSAPKHEPQCTIQMDRNAERVKLVQKPNRHKSQVGTQENKAIHKLEPIFDNDSGKENVSTVANEKPCNINSDAITNTSFMNKETVILHPNLMSNQTNKPHTNDAASKDIPNDVPINHNEGKEMSEIEHDSLSCDEVLRKSPITSAVPTILNGFSSTENETIANVKMEKIQEDAQNKMCETFESTSRLQHLRASITEDHCYSLPYKRKEFKDNSRLENSSYPNLAENNSNINGKTQHETSNECLWNEDICMDEKESKQQAVISTCQNVAILQESPGQIVSKRTNEEEPQTQPHHQPFYVASNSDRTSQSSNLQYVLPMGSTFNITDPPFVEDGMNIISEKQIIPGCNNTNQSNLSSTSSIFVTSNPVPISPIPSTNNVPTRAKASTRSASASGFTTRVESKKVPEQADNEKSEALQAIRELQAKGATTEDLSCHICQPSKCFTAYTTLLSHLRSHAGIRKFNCSSVEITKFLRNFLSGLVSSH